MGLLDDIKKDAYLHSIMLLLYLSDTSAAVIYFSNLHSIMLLLYLCPHCQNEVTVQIYIPLCFYFIYELLYNDINL